MAEPITVLGSVIAGSLAFIQSIAGEAWTRYFIILAALGLDSVIGAFSGFYILESIIGFVISNLLGLQDFIFPVYYGVSSLFLLTVIMPFAFFILKMAIDNK